MTNSIQILYYDDSQSDAGEVIDALRSQPGFAVTSSASVEQFEQNLRTGLHDIVLSATRQPEGSEKDVVSTVRTIHEDLPVLILRNSDNALHVESPAGHSTDESVPRASSQYHALPERIRAVVDGLRQRQSQHHPGTFHAQADRHFRIGFNQALVSMAHVTPHGRFIRVNAQFGKLLGYDIGEMVGRSFADFTHPEDVALSLEHLSAFERGDVSSCRFDKRYLHKNGETVWVEANVSAARISSGRMDFLILIAQDISGRMRMESALKESWRFATMTLDALQEHICVIDEHGEIVAVNRAWREFAAANGALPQRVMEGSNYLDACEGVAAQSAGEAVQFSAGARAVLSGQRDSYSLEYPCHSPTEQRWFRVRVTRFGGGGPVRAVVAHENITQRKMAEDHRRFQVDLLNTVGDAVVAYDLPGTITYWNKASEQLYGWSSEEVLGKNVLHVMPSDVTTEQRQEIHRAIDSGGIWRGRYRVQRRNGRTFPAAAVLAPIRDAEGVITGMTGVSRDISERLDAEQAIRRHAKQQSLIAAFSRTVLTLYNLDDLQDQTVAVIRDGLDVEYCEIALPNPDGNGWMLKAGLGWEHGWVGQSIFDGEAPTHYQEVLASGEPILVANFRNEQRFKSLEIHQAHGIVSAAAVPISGAGGVHGVLGALSHDPDRFTLEDIDFLQSLANTLEAALERKQAEDKLTQLAQFDVVTGLPNRSLFRDRLSQALAQVQRNGGLLGVLFVDLDGFKAVNDTLGHTAGDTLLDQVGQRLQYSVRSGDTVSRLAGDEFAILLTNLAKTEDAGKVAEKILAECARAFHVGGNQTFVSASIGVALHPGDGNDTDQLLKNADIAMYRAKEQGRNNYQFYLPQMHERALERMRLEAELRGALSRDEFVLHYQPKVDLHNGEICGFEALLRWQHPERGLVPPVKFISILEDTGLIVPVGEWVIRTVCAQILSWQELGMKIHPVAVNLSSRQFQHKNIDIVIRRILDSTGVNPRLLEFEVTESLLMQDAEEAVRMLHNMKSFGVRLSVDDFGTGYSSLAYLKRFPLDVLKIDRAFIRDCITDPDDATIVQAIISLAQNLKLKVVAEGVETEAQLHFLRALGCDHMQGYFFSKPVEIDAVNRMLAEDVRLQSKFVDNGAGERTVLLVDDNEYDLLLWRDAFAPLDCRILTAVSAELALDILANNAIDIVISDQNMPTMSGTRFLSTVRQFYPDAIRIMLTGDESNETLPNAVNEAGVHRFLSKHWSPERLLKEVRETCRQLSHLDPAQRVTQGFA